MTLTSHGHHIEGSPEEVGDIPPAASCGGPGLCSLCTSQVIAWQEAAARENFLNDLNDAISQHQGVLIGTQFVSKQVFIEAIQFTGGPASGMDIERWVNTNGGNATWKNSAEPWQSEDGTLSHDGWPESLTVQTIEGTYPEAPPGWWIVKGTMGEFYPCRDDVFQQKYERVSNG